jgi:hypothetical protein
MPVILATQEAEIRRIEAQTQPRQIVPKILSRKKGSQKRAVGVAQGIDPGIHTPVPTPPKKKKKKGHFLRLLPCKMRSGTGPISLPGR